MKLLENIVRPFLSWVDCLAYCARGTLKKS